MLLPRLEIDLIRSGKYSQIVGIDEVGRGCWAGPVVVGAYLFSESTIVIPGVNDSKLLSVRQREEGASVLQKVSSHVLLWKQAPDIDQLGIAVAIEELIAEICDLFPSSTGFLVDGKFSRQFPANVITVVRGDRMVYSVAAASILAKVARDAWMKDQDKNFPEYGFGQHKGYGTKAHMQALSNHGVTALHRRSFKPVKDLV